MGSFVCMKFHFQFRNRGNLPLDFLVYLRTGLSTPKSDLMWVTDQKLKFSIKDFFSTWYQIPPIIAPLVTFIEKILKENFIFCAVVLSSECLQKLQGSSYHHLTVIWEKYKGQTLTSRPCMVNSVICL